MRPYNLKIWSMDLNSLGTYWLNKLPDVAFRQTVLSCLTREPVGSLACHVAFLYRNDPAMAKFGGPRLEPCTRLPESDSSTKR